MMYYFVPKQARPPHLFSYRLSIIHFWALIFLYIWAGSLTILHYTALPDWAQTLGMVFSIMLVDAILGRHDQWSDDACQGAWDKLRTDPVLRMFVIWRLAFYGMSTFEGPMMSIKAVNSLSHYTDWTIGHVHSGALGLERHDHVWCAYTTWCQNCGIVSQLYSLQTGQLAPVVGHHRHRRLRGRHVGGRQSPRG